MTDKIIDEVMSLISDWSEKDFLWGSAQIDAQSEMATSADFFNEKRYGEEAKSAKDAIRAKLREVLERKPISREKFERMESAAYAATRQKGKTPFEYAEDLKNRIEKFHQIGAE